MLKAITQFRKVYALPIAADPVTPKLSSLKQTVTLSPISEGQNQGVASLEGSGSRSHMVSVGISAGLHHLKIRLGLEALNPGGCTHVPVGKRLSFLATWAPS